MAINKPRKITDEELKSIVDAEIEAAQGEMSGELSDQRSDAMDRYLGEPMGNEMEGRSQVQTRDVFDVIEWVLPYLVEVFTESDKAIEIEPQGPEDEPQAEQETDYIHYLFFRKMNGFLILYSWFKDALLSKTGIVKTWAEEVEESSRETYQYLTDEEFAALMADDEMELIEYEEEPVLNDLGQPIRVHHATFMHTERDIQITTEVLPPEEFIISRDARTVDPKKARFSGHKTTKTVSDLREMGYTDKQIREMDVGDLGSHEFSDERLARLNLSDEERWGEEDLMNEAMRPVSIVEGYIRADKNGDGVAELLKVFRSGKFIESEEIDSNPFAAITPIILTHKFHGLSIADIIKDLQEIRTGLMRAYMDNAYQTINGTTYYDENRVNVDDMLVSTPYGNRAVDGSPNDAVLHIKPDGLPAQAFTLFDLTDQLKNERIGDFQSQVDPNVMSQANVGVVTQLLTEAKAKVRMIARIFGETGVKQLFRDLHELSRKHTQKDEIVKLRNQWVPVDPREWRERKNLRVCVGLGSRTRQERIYEASTVIDLQMKMAELGLPVAMPQNIYHAAKDYSESLGRMPEFDWTDPSTLPPPEPQPDHALLQIEALKEIEAGKREIDRYKADLDLEAKMQGMIADYRVKSGVNEIKTQELSLKDRDLSIEEQDNLKNQQLEALKRENEVLKIMVDAAKAGVDADIKRQGLEKQQKSTESTMQNAKKTKDADTKALVNEVKKLLDPQQAINADITSALRSIQDQLKELDSDKEIMRDSEGRIIQIGNKKIKRDKDGRATGITR